MLIVPVAPRISNLLRYTLPNTLQHTLLNYMLPYALPHALPRTAAHALPYTTSNPVPTHRCCNLTFVRHSPYTLPPTSPFQVQHTTSLDSVAPANPSWKPFPAQLRSPRASTFTIKTPAAAPPPTKTPSLHLHPSWPDATPRNSHNSQLRTSFRLSPTGLSWFIWPLRPYTVRIPVLIGSHISVRDCSELMRS